MMLFLAFKVKGIFGNVFVKVEMSEEGILFFSASLKQLWIYEPVFVCVEYMVLLMF